MTDLDQHIEHYLEKSLESDFEIDQIRKELTSNNVSEADIRAVVRRVDEAVQHRAIEDVKRDHSRTVILIGIVIAFLGLLVSVGSFLGLVPSGNRVAVAYGPFLSGLVVIFAGLAIKGRQSKSDERISRSIKRPL